MTEKTSTIKCTHNQLCIINSCVGLVRARSDGDDAMTIEIAKHLVACHSHGELAKLHDELLSRQLQMQIDIDCEEFCDGK